MNAIERPKFIPRHRLFFSSSSLQKTKITQIITLGAAYVLFPKTNHKYTWHKVTTTVNNIIVGKLWVDQHGDTEIVGLNSSSGIKCILKYIPYSYFSREAQRRVKGVVIDRNNKVKWVIRGTSDNQIEIAKVRSISGLPDSPEYETGIYGKGVCFRQTAKTLAAQLNEMEEGVAPTDSRHRPDQRLMEVDKWDESNHEKLRLEEKQREKRKQREEEAEAAATRENYGLLFLMRKLFQTK
uniref:Uncharacterized protein n=1 Tax=Glossina palpalis gambiensis TaxID=67801 RepID=A0A1B0BDE1_9MUSC